MKKIILILTFFWGIQSISCQDVWVKVFGEDSEIGYTKDECSFKLLNDGQFFYFTSQSQMPDGFPYQPQTTFHKVDFKGEEVLKKTISIVGNEPYFLNRGRLKWLKDGNILQCGWASKGPKPYKMILKMSPEGERLWVFIGDVGKVEDVTELENGDLVCSTFDITGKGSIMKISPSGSVLWENELPTPSGWKRFRGRSMLYYPNAQEFIVTSQLVKNGEPVACLTKVDSSGSMIWEKTYYNMPPYDFSYIIEPTINNEFFMTCNLDTLGPDLPYFEYRVIAKLDTSGQILWDTLTTYNGGRGAVLDLVTTVDGDLIGVGSSRFGQPALNEPFFQGANIFKYSNSGTLLWEHIYDFSDELEIVPYNTAVAVTMVENGYGVLGEVARQRPENESFGQRDVFLLYLDDNGCYTSSCDSVATLTGLKDWPLKESVKFDVFPNPTNGQFTIKFPKELGYYNITIFDTLGRVVREIKHAVTGQEFELNKSGLYFLRLSKKGALLGSQTILVTK